MRRQSTWFLAIGAALILVCGIAYVVNPASWWDFYPDQLFVGAGAAAIGMIERREGR